MLLYGALYQGCVKRMAACTVHYIDLLGRGCQVDTRVRVIYAFHILWIYGTSVKMTAGSVMVTRFVIKWNHGARNFVCVCIIAFDLKFASVCGRHKNKTVIPSIHGKHRLRDDQLGLTLYSLCAVLIIKKRTCEKAIKTQRADY